MLASCFRTISALATVAFLSSSISGALLASEAPERAIRLSVVTNLDHPQGLGAKRFAESVAAASAGKIKVTVFPGGTLGGETQAVTALQSGTLEATIVAPAVLVGQVKEFIVLDFPFVFTSEQEAAAILDGPFGARLMERLAERGLVGLVYMEVGFRHFTNNKRPITKVDDFSGLKLRAVQNPLYVDFTNALGAHAAAMAYTELYTALETRAIDGHENPYTTIESAKFDEVQKYLSATRHIYNPQILLFSRKFWDQLSAAEQKILSDAAVGTRSYQRDAARELDSKARDTLIKRGMKVNDLPAEEMARLREKAKPVIDKYAGQVGEPLMGEFYAELEKLRARK